MVWWRTGGFYRSLAAAIAAGAVAINFQQSRPFLVTFVLLAVTMAILERRRWMWALVPMFIFWANCHGGYFMGWVMLGAYCGEALIQRLRKRPVEGERQLWLVTIASFLASAINPNGFRVIEIMLLLPQQRHPVEQPGMAVSGVLAAALRLRPGADRLAGRDAALVAPHAAGGLDSLLRLRRRLRCWQSAIPF